MISNSRHLTHISDLNGYLNNTCIAMVTMKLIRMIAGSAIKRYTKAVVLMLFCLIALSYSSVQILFESESPLLKGQTVWGQTSQEIFPNSTMPAILGNRSLIPGMHVMSLVHDVKPTWLIVSSDNELSVNMRSESTTGLTTPTVSLLATALRTTGDSPQLSSSAVAYERITGTNITQAGWISPITVPIFVEGTLSLYDADLIVVMIVPYTGPLLSNSTTTTTTNSSSVVIPQNENVT